ncbi:conserved hypothetical protein [Hyphomicrobium sp. GJ21]|mgnify:CR=1 FL=1|jgi:uncharacterized protein (UPF0262 family)|uniref:UPF0262 family protein n=1 Tax=Hyphomicrobium sp. GJ21 TaxID=113574 RepID=UPI000622B737|nr:UPF0262 family protein [Hyphomicrobium sp. GJ21]CEJ88157.1 conserved hypothetical protein [Hyphomicrobium sp. GJ21]
MDQTVSSAGGRDRLAEITLDTKSLGRANANAEHEREVAIFDILDGNTFRVEDVDDGPYKLHLSIVDDRLQMNVAAASSEQNFEHAIALTPLKRIMKDYFMVCESYYEAVKTAPPARIQAIDVSRRGLHDEGSVLLRDKLLPKIIVDDDTARRLFTLVCSLHWKG